MNPRTLRMPDVLQARRPKSPVEVSFIFESVEFCRRDLVLADDLRLALDLNYADGVYSPDASDIRDPIRDF